ncbi:SUMO-specific isopeptidase USPL1 isoform X4 [Chiloscyllium plagiosum]|uniref:SUMO-specific isopeptidase USPL1 isoform X4 n=1 Tax=Chiloscyllium plagiosum TaxID=36176 RepID=UPI001CB7C889|nr:SUMO-specific isopeptidase USPL1 isoform X4 [Chiloscyllium plagiosum]
MVKVSLWLSMADKQKTKTGLPLSGPSTDINVSSSHTVGYLGKFSENTSLIQEQYCPACAAKGENKALRRFYISLEESVLLCESPQCVFPLGCKPLNEILISPTLPRSSVQAAKSISGSGALVPLCNGLWKIPPETLGRIELTLSNVRESLFQLLRPKLKCELGVPDSPVFAFPQLLRQDPYVEALFMQSYIWSFECMKCGYKYEERCRKTLITFTNIVSDWHPLNAVHKATCNNCRDKDQKRKMLLDCVSSIYMLHFVEGLPHADLDSYRFDFQGNSYRICTIIQYLQAVKHFVTWIQNSNGMYYLFKHQFSGLGLAFFLAMNCFSVYCLK